MFGCCDDNSWIIWIIVIFLLLGNNGCDNGCDNGCGNGLGLGLGSGTDIILIIILLLVFAGGDNGLGGLFGSCAKES